MSFRKFMLHGIDSELKRENHPVDTVEAKKSSFDYSGKITAESLQNFEKLVVVDNAVHISIKKPNERKEIQSTLNDHEMKANITAASGVVGLGYSLYRAVMGDYIYGALGALASFGMIGLGLERASQAKVERIKWNEPTQEVCDTRRAARFSFKSLMNKNLKGSHFTAEETQNVFHQSVSQLDLEYTHELTKSNPQTMQAWVDRFSNENPIHAHALKYAFSDQTVIQDPEHPENGYWERKNLNELAEKSRKFSTELTSFHAETEQQLQEIYNRQNLERATIHSTALLAQTLMNESTKDQLDENERDEQTNLSQLRSSQYSPFELKRRAQEIENVHKLNAEQAKSSMEQNKLTSNTVAFAASTLSDVVAANQRGTLFANRRQEFMKQFPSQAGDILAGYHSTRESNLRR